MTIENARYKVLLIEDDKLDQAAFKRLVGSENLPYDYTIASSVRQAADILHSQKFDIVIVDYLLGDGTAFDLFDSIIDTPAIFATGAGNEELAVKAMKAHAYDYLIKDLDRNYLKVLPKVIKNAVNHKKAEDKLKRYHDNLEVLVKERTEQLATEKELLSVTLSSMADAVIAVDAEKRIILFNKVAENLTGWNLEDALDKDVDEIFHIINEQNRQTIDSPIDKVLRSGKIETNTGENCLISRTGRECPVAVNTAPIQKNNGTMLGVVMVFRDVSREREIDRMKDNFISSVSHELRTPLSSIKAYTATILRDHDMPPETRNNFLAVIDEESNRLTSLIEDLLEVSQIESGTVKITPESVDIAALINQVVSALRPLADDKNIRLKPDLDDDLPPLQADKTKFLSIVTNLLNNAIKFTPHGGSVAISAHHQAQDLVIQVSDTGIGIPKEDLPKIFNRFYRVQQPGKQIPGTGLGLAIVKKIVIMHGGRINVESEPNKGSTFTVFLPLVPQHLHQLSSAD